MVEKADGKESNAKKQRKALLIELEYVALGGRKILYDVFRSVLGSKEIDITPPVFSRRGIDVSAGSFVERMLRDSGKTRLSHDKLLAEINDGIRLSLADRSVKIDASVGNIVDSAVKAGFAVGALGFLDKESLSGLAAMAEFSAKGVAVMGGSGSGTSTCGRELWLAMARSLKITPSRCVAVVSSAGSCRAALAAGMKCVALPDEFTSFQDFGGADLVLDSIEGSPDEVILGLLP